MGIALNPPYKPHNRGTVYIEDTSNANMTVGLTINQGAADDEAIALKSSDIAHGMTSLTETDTYGYLRKTSAEGGVTLLGFSDADDTTKVAISMSGTTGVAADTTDTSSSVGIVNLQGFVKSGTGQAAVADSGNVFSIRNATTARLLIKGNGDIHTTTVVDVTGTGNAVSATAFDNEDDAQLIRAFETARKGEGLIEGPFDEFVRYNEDDLVRLGILGAPVAEGGMWNLTQHTRLLNGAIWQLYTKVQESEARALALEKKLAALEIVT